ncbi:hypothetical protein DXU03_39320 [Rhizobium johnstonii]
MIRNRHDRLPQLQLKLGSQHHEICFVFRYKPTFVLSMLIAFAGSASGGLFVRAIEAAMTRVAASARQRRDQS